MEDIIKFTPTELESTDDFFFVECEIAAGYTFEFKPFDRIKSFNYFQVLSENVEYIERPNGVGYVIITPGPPSPLDKIKIEVPKGSAVGYSILTYHNYDHDHALLTVEGFSPLVTFRHTAGHDFRDPR